MATSLRSGTPVRTYTKRDRVAEALAKRLLMKPESAHQVLVGQLNFRVAEIIGAFRDANEPERLERWLGPIRAALEFVAEEPLTRALIIRAQEADAAEDVAESAYLTDPCPATQDHWIRRIREQRVAGLALDMALVRDRREHLA